MEKGLGSGQVYVEAESRQGWAPAHDPHLRKKPAMGSSRVSGPGHQGAPQG